MRIPSRCIRIIVSTCVVTVATVCVHISQGHAAPQSLPPHAAGELLIGFKRTASDSDTNRALAKVQGKFIKRMRAKRDVELGSPGIDHIKISGPVSTALEALQNDPSVAFVEPNYWIQKVQTANDSYYTNGSLWGMYGDDVPMCGPTGTTNTNGADAEEAWSLGFTGSNSVYIGVIDEGVQHTHPDLAANMWVNPYDVVDGIDNDGNGYIDDTNGWDFYNRDRTVYDSGDGDAHGTHVSGTIGGRGGNGAGVVGVNWNVSIISTKFLGPTGGYTSDAVSAINYLRDLKTRHGLNIVASNNSWGGGGYSSALHTAILRAAKQGILFVAAAGNASSNNDTTANYPSNYTTLQGTSVEGPASYEAVIAVAAINSTGGLASFSNYGATTVDIGAPGVSILSTVPTNSYASYNGTSMAAPHVSGAVALYASAFPSATAQQIRSALLANAAPTASLVGRTVTGGRLNLNGLFSSSPATPTPVATSTPTFTATPTRTITPTATATPTSTITPTATATPTPTDTVDPTLPTATPTVTPTATFTFTPVPPTATPTPAPVIADVAVTSLGVSGKVRTGATVSMVIGLANQGTKSETFTVSLSVSAGTAGASKTVTLAAGARGSATISWTLPKTKGTYTATGRASVVAGEVDTADNVLSGSLQVR